MYICICNGFRDHELRALGAAGIRCAEEAYAHLGGHPKCGACLDSAKEVLDEAAESAGASETQAA